MRRYYLLMGLPALLALQILLGWLYFQKHEGFLLAYGDGYYRVALSWEWMTHRSFFVGWPAWLPLPFWLESVALHYIQEDLGTVSSFINFVFSLGSTAFLFFISRLLLGEEAGFWAAALAVLNLSFLALGIQGGMPDAILHFFILGSCLLLILLERTEKKAYLLSSSLFLFLASWVRLEAWFFLPAYSWLILRWGKKQKHHRKLVLVALAMAWSGIAAWLGHGAWTGRPWETLHHYRDWSTPFSPSEMTVSFLRNLLDADLSWFSIWAALLGLFALGPFKPPVRNYLLFPLSFFCFYSAALLVNMAYPGKGHLFLGVILLLPLSGKTVSSVLARIPSLTGRALGSFLSLGLFAYPLLQDGGFAFPKARLSEFRAYQLFRRAWSKGILEDRDVLLVELWEQARQDRVHIYWPLIFKTIRTPSNALFDRRWSDYSKDPRTTQAVLQNLKEHPSVFSFSGRTLERFFKSQRVRAVVLHSPKAIAQVQPFMAQTLETGPYKVFVFRSDTILREEMDALWREILSRKPRLKWLPDDRL